VDVRGDHASEDIELEFVPLDRMLIQEVEPWFDDVETQRYLGDRSWIRRELDLVATQPGTEFRGRTIKSRLAWVVRTHATSVAFVVVERYSDASAGLAFVVAPTHRGRGLGRAMLLALDSRPELAGVARLIGGIEPDNVRARRMVESAGFTVAETPDHEGILRIEKLQRILVRSATGDDAEDVARIYVDSWNSGFRGLMPYRSLTPDLIDRWREDLNRPLPHRWWVAERAGSIIGLVGIGPSRDPVDPTLGELDTIAVEPTHWRRGIGRTLMSTALCYLKADGYSAAILWTLANYELGQRFYEATGWCPDGGVRDEGRQVRYRHDLHD